MFPIVSDGYLQFHSNISSYECDPQVYVYRASHFRMVRLFGNNGLYLTICYINDINFKTNI